MINKIKNIDKKKLIMTILSLIVFLLLFIAVEQKSKREVDRVNIRISKIKNQRSLIKKKDVVLIFRGYLGYDLSLANFSELNLKMLEQVLVDDVRVKNAEIYIDAQNTVNVFIQQRKPVVRINDGEAYNYYLDEDGIVVPVAKKNAIRVPIATGNIENLKSGFIKNKKTNLNDVFELAKFVNKDDFLKALIEQIHVREDNSIVVIPKMGREKIIVGDIADLDENFEKLKIFYRNGLPKRGWDKFAELNLSYKKQVITQKR